jgi:serine/threonine protein kinase
MDKHVKIIDFGLSTYITRNQKHDLKCGTDLYLSPEIKLNQKYNQKTDVWSFGLVIYKIISYYIGNVLKGSEVMLNLNLESVIYQNNTFKFTDQWKRFKELQSIITSCLCWECERVTIYDLKRQIDCLM